MFEVNVEFFEGMDIHLLEKINEQIKKLLSNFGSSFLRSDNVKFLSHQAKRDRMSRAESAKCLIHTDGYSRGA